MRLRQYLGIDLAVWRDDAKRNKKGGASGCVATITAVVSSTAIVSFHPPAGA